tara:strand:+ start:402 stop:839 length:438 start_codon:yes stop_codon:yes gene_type:complete
MASELKVDKFTGVTTAGSILVTGEGNSTTTNLQQGLVKQFSSFGQRAWGPSAGNSANTAGDTFNTSSHTDTATAVVTVGLTNNMGNITYNGQNSAHYDQSTSNKNYPRMSGCATLTTSSYEAVASYANGSVDDCVMVSLVAGDLA